MAPEAASRRTKVPKAHWDSAGTVVGAGPAPAGVRLPELRLSKVYGGPEPIRTADMDRPAPHELLVLHSCPPL